LALFFDGIEMLSAQRLVLLNKGSIEPGVFLVEIQPDRVPVLGFDLIPQSVIVPHGVRTVRLGGVGSHCGRGELVVKGSTSAGTTHLHWHWYLDPMAT